MFEPRPLGLRGGIGVIDMELLSVIRRWRYRDHYSIREISRRPGLSRNTVRKYLRSDTVEPKFNIPDRSSKLDPYADKLSQMLRQEAGKSRKQKRTVKQLHADLAVLGYDGSYQSRGGLRSRLEGRSATGTEDVRPRRVRAAGVFAGRGVPVRLVGRLGDHRRRADQIAGRSLQALLQPRLHSPGLSAADRRDAVRRPQPRLPRLGGRAAAGHLRQYANCRRQGRPRKRAPSQRALLSHGQPLPVRGGVLQSGFRLGEGADREKRPGRAPSALAAHAALPFSRRAERLAGDAMPRAVGIDAARLTSWHGRRRPGGRSAALDAAFQDVRRLRRIRQARLTDMPGPFGPQSLQRARVLRQSSGQRTSLSRTHRCRRRGTSRLRTSPRFCPLPPTQEYDHRFRLAALSGGHSAQARSPA